MVGINVFTTDNQKVTADVTNNGVLSSNDAAQIARFVAGLGAPIGLTNQWKFYLPPGPTFPVGASPTSRTYASVNSIISGEDYVGLLIGEVSGNWAPTSARPRDSRLESAAIIGDQPEIIVDVPSVTTHDAEVVVPVTVQGTAGKGMISYEFDLRYDPSVVQPGAIPVDVDGAVSRGLAVVTNANEPGLLRVVVYGAYPIDEDGLLLNLRFTVLGKTGSASSLTIDRIMFDEGQRQAIATIGRVEVVGRNSQVF